jgi:hypothetical protein
MGGAAGNFFHQMVDGVISWFGGQKRGTTTLPTNHDLDGLTASAIKLVLETARDRLSTADPKRDSLARLAKTPVATIVEVMQAQDARLVGETEIVGTLGAPAGGQTSTVATPEYWQAFVAALMKHTGAAEQPSAMNTPVRDFTDVFQLAARAVKDATKQLWDKDLTARATDAGAADATVFAAGLLHAHVAAFANDVLRAAFGPQGRFFVAALFNILNSIAAQVQKPPAGVTLTPEHEKQIKAWVRDAAREALAAGRDLPAPRADDEREAAAQVEAQAKTFGETLKQIGEDVVFIRAGMARWCDTLAPDLVLPPRVVAKAQDRFVFRSRRLAVVGRDDELKELSAWLDSSAPFGWDLWVGPAGSGKSRLALELCDRREDWDAGFFRFDGPVSPNWRDWDPKADTLIIFDYVAEDAEKIGHLIDLFTRRAAGHNVRGLPSGVKVRFLLLERAAVRDADAAPPEPTAAAATPPDPAPAVAAEQKLEASWLGVLRSAAKQNGADVESVYARGGLNHQGRYLGGVSVEAAAEIIRSEHASALDPSATPSQLLAPEQMLERLLAVVRIDPHLRPLFVAMTAEAVREKGGAFDALDGGTGIDALVQHINEKEWKHAAERLQASKDGPGAPLDAWAKFVCLATMCGGLKDPPKGPDGRPLPGLRAVLTEALGMAASLNIPNADAYGTGERYALLVSGAHQDDAPKLEPDVLGEGFVLHWLTTHARLARPLINAAWTLGMTDFVRRAAENFPARTEASGMLDPVAGADPAALAAAQTALGAREFARGDLAALRARGKRLLTMAESNGETPLHPARVRALGAFIWMHGTATPEELQQLSAALDRLPAAVDLDASTREPLAKGLTNAIGEAGADHVRVDDLLSRLQALANAHPLDAAVREELAKGLTNAIGRAGADHARVDDLLSRLQALANAHPLDATIPESLAMGLFNAFHNAPANSVRADDLLRSLQALADAHPLDAAVRKQLANGLFNAFYLAPANSARADDLFTCLQALADAHPLDAAVREQVAKGLFNAFYIAPANSACADDLLTRLQALAHAHALDAAVGKLAWKGCGAAFIKSSDPGPPQPRHLHAMAALLSRLAGDDQVRQMTRALIDMVIQMIAQAPLPEPLKSELDSAGGVLRQAYQETFGTDHQ